MTYTGVFVAATGADSAAAASPDASAEFEHGGIKNDMDSSIASTNI